MKHIEDDGKITLWCSGVPLAWTFDQFQVKKKRHFKVNYSALEVELKDF